MYKRQVYINRCQTLEFYLSVSDKDGKNYIRIFHIFNNTLGNIVNTSLNDDSPHEIRYSIPIPNDINVGSCLLKFYGVDEYSLASKYELINVTFENYTQNEMERKREKLNKRQNKFPPIFTILTRNLF